MKKLIFAVLVLAASTVVYAQKGKVSSAISYKEAGKLDKAWETSWTRKLLILTLTYFVVVIFFYIANLPKPFINSLVPTMGFFLSTLTVPWIKTIWLRKNAGNKMNK